MKLDHVKEATKRHSDDAERDEMMKSFWTLLNATWQKSIPPGIIFLPGDKVYQIGFGWAPRTWMSANPTDPPEPLGAVGRPAELDCDGLNGLKIRYPGFLLDMEDRSQNIKVHRQVGYSWIQKNLSHIVYQEAGTPRRPNIFSTAKSYTE